MILKKLDLVNYKSFDSHTFEFDDKINCLLGNNGVGKTNVLDAIYHLSLGKSYFNPVATQNIRHGEEFFMIQGAFWLNDRTEKIVCSLKRGQKKVIKRNDKVYDKLSDHIGLLPVVIISPADRDLIIEGSITRRKFMDGVISQSNKGYLNTLIRYNKILEQRNSLLKYFASNQRFDREALAVYDDQLSELGSPVHQTRKAFIERFVPIFQERHKAISMNGETVDLRYDSQLLLRPLPELLQEAVEKDRVLQYSSAGIHKDDLSFEIDGRPTKKFGSQGQQKTYLIALKLAQFDFIKEQAKFPPVLLLDDVFDKLDEQRVAQIMRLVENEHFGQIFVTDTHPERTEAVIKETHQSYEVFRL